jgi:hypothetical protein
MQFVQRRKPKYKRNYNNNDTTGLTKCAAAGTVYVLFRPTIIEADLTGAVRHKAYTAPDQPCQLTRDGRRPVRLLSGQSA